MCTAVTYHKGGHYFGRNLDLECSYGEGVTITPRAFPLSFRCAPPLPRHHAILGMACVQENYPLYYDAVNEKGLAMAGLNFPEYAAYYPYHAGADNVPPFELIPWVLGQCATLEQARVLLRSTNLLGQDFSPELPLTPLHWMVADRTGSIVVEPMADGLRILENPVEVLTNSPPFDYQMTHLKQFLNLTCQSPENRFSSQLELHPFSRGMGAMGLPGDLSSTSRFVRTAFTSLNSRSGPSEGESVSQFFHILASVAQTRGCAVLPDGSCEVTVYSSCCDLDQGIYYYTTYENSRITAVDLHRENLEGAQLVTYPLVGEVQIFRQN